MLQKIIVVLKSLVRTMIGEGVSTMSDMEELNKKRMEIQNLKRISADLQAQKSGLERKEAELRLKVTQL